MNDFVADGTAVVALAVALFAAVHLVLNRPLGNPLFYAVAVVEVVSLLMLVTGSIAYATTSRDVDGVLYFSYLVTVVVVPPVAVLWGVAEKSRWGTGVVVVAMLTVAVLCVRILQIWSEHA